MHLMARLRSIQPFSLSIEADRFSRPETFLQSSGDDQSSQGGAQRNRHRLAIQNGFCPLVDLCHKSFLVAIIPRQGWLGLQDAVSVGVFHSVSSLDRIDGNLARGTEKLGRIIPAIRCRTGVVERSNLPIPEFDVAYGVVGIAHLGKLCVSRGHAHSRSQFGPAPFLAKEHEGEVDIVDNGIYEDASRAPEILLKERARVQLLAPMGPENNWLPNLALLGF